MTTSNIIAAFTANGYKITKVISTGNIVVTPKSGFAKTFESYTEAYRYYFN